MLACARIGAIHNVVFGGFAAKELSVRIDASQPRVILAASNGVQPTKTVPFQPILEEAMAMSQFKPQYCLYKNRSLQVPTSLSISQLSNTAVQKLKTEPVIKLRPYDGSEPLFVYSSDGSQPTLFGPEACSLSDT